MDLVEETGLDDVLDGADVAVDVAVDGVVDVTSVQTQSVSSSADEDVAAAATRFDIQQAFSRNDQPMGPNVKGLVSGLWSWVIGSPGLPAG
jgi:hypothetical protein